MSAADSQIATDRVAAKRQDLGADGFGPYAFLVLAMLAQHAPEVLHFLLDRADAFIEDES